MLGGFMSSGIGQIHPLEGTKVIDFTHFWAGPTCTMLLAEMGADVVKIEPLTGDPYRSAAEGCSFVNANRNKRGISLNLKSEEAKEIALRLVKTADVLVENFTVGTMDRIGLGYDAISSINPRIIYCSISGFGQNGPYKNYPLLDPVAQAMSGIMMGIGEPDRPPVRILPVMLDYDSGMHAAYGIIASLLDREKTNKGRRIDVSLLDVAINHMAPYITNYVKSGKLPIRAGSGHAERVPYQAFKTQDGSVLIGANTDKMWQNLCKAMQLEHLGCDARYSTIKGRVKNQQELVMILEKETLKYKSRELESLLMSAGVPCGKIRNIDEIIEESFVKTRGIIEDINYPNMGWVKIVRMPIFIDGKPFDSRIRAPLLGEHTVEVLKEIGYGDNAIQEIIKKGVALQHGTNFR